MYIYKTRFCPIRSCQFVSVRSKGTCSEKSRSEGKGKLLRRHGRTSQKARPKGRDTTSQKARHNFSEGRARLLRTLEKSINRTRTTKRQTSQKAGPNFSEGGTEVLRRYGSDLLRRSATPSEGALDRPPRLMDTEYFGASGAPF